MTKLVVGLGNVGKRYAHTRHNIGFMVVDELARRLKSGAGSADAQIYGHTFTDWQTEPKLKSDIFSTDLGGQLLILAKPQTMMNLSGDAVQRLMQKYRLKPADLWVLYDDVDVNFGRLRLRVGATSGQQGIRSITSAIGSQFVHARLGISLNDRAVEPSEVYVLKPFNESEQIKLPQVIAAAAQVLQSQLQAGEPVESTFELI
ncbi:MAG: aminoacyl-tRNA hydrolase [Candidatus Saccharimonadales bacterium]